VAAGYATSATNGLGNGRLFLDNALVESAESALAPGYRLDRYELLCPIATGGMATVWLARLRGKRGFEKLFAIKTIKAELIADARYHEMFLDEARIASGIDHANVAHIVDLGEHAETLYIVMEWVDGEPLAKLHRLAMRGGRPLPTKVVLRVIADACAGLHAAHELKNLQGESLGIVHRDVSPQNILLSSAGHAKVIDFGVAKARRRGAGDTQSGVVKGKIRYMAPEHVAGRPMDRRGDVWALGICLHELLDGRPPYDDLDDIEVVRHLMGADPAPRWDSVSLTPGVRAVLARALAVDPEARFPTAAAMRVALEAALDELGGATAEEVAERVRADFPELEAKRRDTVSRALAAAEGRESGRSIVGRPLGAADPVAEGEIGLAPTVVGAPEAVSDGARVPAPTSSARGLSTGGATLSESLVVPRSKGGAGKWIALGALGLVAVGAAFVWPGLDRIRVALGVGADPASATTVASAAPSVTAAPQLSASAPVVASASASAAPLRRDAGAAVAPPPADAGAEAAASFASQWVAVRGDDGVIEWVRRDAAAPLAAVSASAAPAGSAPAHAPSAAPPASAAAPERPHGD